MTGPAELVDVTVALHGIRERVIMVSPDGDREHAVALSLAQIDYARLPIEGQIEVTLPRSLAQETGLL